MSEHHSGFVAIIGRPNVGKSTFMNRILGEKIAIMSPKAQTTRNKINGIYTTPDAQIVFVDTPGIHKPKNELDDYMDKAALSITRYSSFMRSASPLAPAELRGNRLWMRN